MPKTSSATSATSAGVNALVDVAHDDAALPRAAARRDARDARHGRAVLQSRVGEAQPERALRQAHDLLLLRRRRLLRHGREQHQQRPRGRRQGVDDAVVGHAVAITVDADDARAVD